MRSLTVCILALAACCAPTRGDRPTLPIVPYTPLGSAPGGRIAADGGQLTYGGLQRVSHTAAMVGYGTPSSLLDLRTDCAANETLVWSGAAWVCAAAPGDIGTGTAPDLAAWTGANTLGNYAGTGSVADKAISALSATGAATFSYFVDSGATGVTVSNNVASIDPTYTQRRVTGTCSDPFGIITIAQDGTVTCSTTTVGSASGTTNTLPMYTAARTLGNSIVAQSGTNLVNISSASTDSTYLQLTNSATGGRSWYISSGANLAGVPNRLSIYDVTGSTTRASFGATATTINGLSTDTLTLHGVTSIDAATSITAGTPGLNISNATQATERLRFSGQEYYQAAHTSTDGITFLIGLQRTGNRSLWIADSAQLASNTSNGTLQIGIQASSAGASIDSIATDIATALPLAINPSHGAVNVGGVLDVSSHKITSCANGTASSDGACFGQIATGVNAAVAGSSPFVAKFVGANAVGTGSIKDNLVTRANGTRVDVLFGGAGVYDLSVTADADNNANAYIFQNAYEKYNTGGDATLYWDTTHGSFGSRGVAFKAADGISFYADAVATTADTSFTPTRRMLISNAGGVTVDQTLTSTGALTASSTLTQTAGNVTLNTSSGTSAITGHGTTAGDLQIADATTGLAAGNYLNTTLSFSGTVHEGTGAGSAPCTNGFKCVKTLSVSNTGDVVTISEGNAISWIAIYADSNNAHDTSIALYTDHGDVKLNQISGSLLAHGAATFDNGITSTAVTNTLGDLTINNTIAVTSTATLSGATTVKNDFFVATTGGTNKLKVLAATGHVNVLGTAITTGDLSACGTTPAVATGSTDVAGRITEGTTATGCTVTFKNSYTNVPFCVCTGETSGVAAVLVGCHATATTLVLENASASSDTYQYFCVGQSGGT